MLTLDRIYQAQRSLVGVARKTEVIKTDNLVNNCSLYLKTENLQSTGSFKLRGAYFKMANLNEDERQREIIACSAGNHAQGVAMSAKLLGLRAKIFIPGVAPIFKIEATRRMGAAVEIIDGVYDDAYTAAFEYKNKTGGIFIHPFDDIDVIAGQGTVGLEILEQVDGLDAVVVPVGGGGLISGVAFAIKKLNPKCKVYGVQAVGAGSMCDSLECKSRKSLSRVSTFADGIAVKSPGELTFGFCEKYVDKMVTVTDDEIATAILSMMEQQKIVAEGAGAVAVAAVAFDKLPIKDKKVCAVVSGGNIDVNILSRVIARGLLTTGRLSDLSIEMLDKPGQLREVSTIIAEQGANVTKVRHNYGGENTDIAGCFLHISMETRNKQHLDSIRIALEKAGYNIMNK